MKLLALTLCLLPLATHAADPTYLQTMAEWNRTLAESAELTKKKCGFRIETRLEEQFLEAGFREAKKDAGAFCAGVLEGIRLMCPNETAKAAVEEKVKTLVCKAGKGDEVKFNLVGSALEFTFGPQAKNIYPQAKKYLEGNL